MTSAPPKGVPPGALASTGPAYEAVQQVGDTAFAFSTVNDALGARPDAELRARVPGPVLDAVTFGRPIAEGSA